MNFTGILRGAAGFAVLTMALSTPLQAGTVENLERERALVIGHFLDPALSPQDRQGAVSKAKSRLHDLERMVLRDDSLKGRNTPTVRRAFANYDLTFLVHASAEKNLGLFDSWLTELGIDTDSLMTARPGRR